MVNRFIVNRFIVNRFIVNRFTDDKKREAQCAQLLHCTFPQIPPDRAGFVYNCCIWRPATLLDDQYGK
jgi:hypothetical protein